MYVSTKETSASNREGAQARRTDTGEGCLDFLRPPPLTGTVAFHFFLTQKREHSLAYTSTNLSPSSVQPLGHSLQPQYPLHVFHHAVQDRTPLPGLHPEPRRT